jgi:hypothetical protein
MSKRSIVDWLGDIIAWGERLENHIAGMTYGDFISSQTVGRVSRRRNPPPNNDPLKSLAGYAAQTRPTSDWLSTSLRGAIATKQSMPQQAGKWIASLRSQ